MDSASELRAITRSSFSKRSGNPERHDPPPVNTTFRINSYGGRTHGRTHGRVGIEDSSSFPNWLSLPLQLDESQRSPTHLVAIEWEQTTIGGLPTLW